MSNDQYQQRQFFEESGPFPDFKYYVDNHLVILPYVTDNSSDEERSKEIKQLGQSYGKIKSSRSMDADFQFKLEEFNRRNNI